MIETGSATPPAAAAAPDPIGDRAARFQRFVVPELDMLARMAGRFCVDRAEAEDLVQETLLRAYRSIQSFDGRHPRSWLITIMRNLRRTMAHRPTPVTLPDDDAAFDRPGTGGREDPGRIATGRACEEAAAAAIAGLPRAMAEVVELVDVAGLSYREAAAALEVPLGTVMSRLHRARDRLSRELSRQGWTPEVVADGLEPATCAVS